MIIRLSPRQLSVATRIIAIGCGLLLISELAVKIIAGLYFDDSYMFVRYANNIVSYGNYGWNAHEHTYGCTNIPFTYFIALLKLMHLDQLLGLSTMLLLSSFFWSVLSLILLYKVIFLIIKDSLVDNRWLILLLVCSVTTAEVFSYNILTGMDTTMSLFFNLVLIYFLVRYKISQRVHFFLLSVWFSYFTFLIRPDNGIYAVLFPLLFFLDAGTPRKKIILFFVLLFFLFGVDALIKYMYFGDPLPLPYYVKKSGFYLGFTGLYLWNPLLYTFLFLYNFSYLFFVFLIFCNRAAVKKFLVFGLPVLISLGYYLTVTQIMGFHARYYLPSMPFWIAGAAYGFTAVKSFQIKPKNFFLPLLFAMFLLLFDLVIPINFEYLQRKGKTEAAKFQLQEPSVNRLSCKILDYEQAILQIKKVIDILPPGETVAATEYGYLSAYSTDKRFFDLCGLHDIDIAKHGYKDSMLLKWKPALIWLPAKEYTGLRKEIIEGEHFKVEYDYFPDAFSYGVAVRKDSPFHNDLIKKIIEVNCSN